MAFQLYVDTRITKSGRVSDILFRNDCRVQRNKGR